MRSPFHVRQVRLSRALSGTGRRGVSDPRGRTRDRTRGGGRGGRSRPHASRSLRADAVVADRPDHTRSPLSDAVTEVGVFGRPAAVDGLGVREARGHDAQGERCSRVCVPPPTSRSPRRPRLRPRN